MSGLRGFDHYQLARFKEAVPTFAAEVVYFVNKIGVDLIELRRIAFQAETIEDEHEMEHACTVSGFAAADNLLHDTAALLMELAEVGTEPDSIERFWEQWRAVRDAHPEVDERAMALDRERHPDRY
jgi:hypothetical protein